MGRRLLCPLTIEHLQQVFAIRGGSGSDGILAVEIMELPATATTHHLEPVRPAERHGMAADVSVPADVTDDEPTSSAVDTDGTSSDEPS